MNKLIITIVLLLVGINIFAQSNINFRINKDQNKIIFPLSQKYRPFIQQAVIINDTAIIIDNNTKYLDIILVNPKNLICMIVCRRIFSFSLLD